MFTNLYTLPVCKKLPIYKGFPCYITHLNEVILEILGEWDTLSERISVTITRLNG
jgi:hypothetical protein